MVTKYAHDVNFSSSPSSVCLSLKEFICQDSIPEGELKKIVDEVIRACDVKGNLGYAYGNVLLTKIIPGNESIYGLLLLRFAHLRYNDLVEKLVLAKASIHYRFTESGESTLFYLVRNDTCIDLLLKDDAINELASEVSFEISNDFNPSRDIIFEKINQKLHESSIKNRFYSELQKHLTREQALGFMIKYSSHPGIITLLIDYLMAYSQSPDHYGEILLTIISSRPRDMDIFVEKLILAGANLAMQNQEGMAANILVPETLGYYKAALITHDQSRKKLLLEQANQYTPEQLNRLYYIFQDADTALQDLLAEDALFKESKNDSSRKRSVFYSIVFDKCKNKPEIVKALLKDNILIINPSEFKKIQHEDRRIKSNAYLAITKDSSFKEIDQMIILLRKKKNYDQLMLVSAVGHMLSELASRKINYNTDLRMDINKLSFLYNHVTESDKVKLQYLQSFLIQYQDDFRNARRDHGNLDHFTIILLVAKQKLTQKNVEREVLIKDILENSIRSYLENELEMSREDADLEMAKKHSLIRKIIFPNCMEEKEESNEKPIQFFRAAIDGSQYSIQRLADYYYQDVLKLISKPRNGRIMLALALAIPFVSESDSATYQYRLTQFHPEKIYFTPEKNKKLTLMKDFYLYLVRISDHLKKCYAIKHPFDLIFLAYEHASQANAFATDEIKIIGERFKESIRTAMMEEGQYTEEEYDAFITKKEEQMAELGALQIFQDDYVVLEAPKESDSPPPYSAQPSSAEALPSVARNSSVLFASQQTNGPAVQVKGPGVFDSVRSYFGL